MSFSSTLAAQLKARPVPPRIGNVALSLEGPCLLGFRRRRRHPGAVAVLALSLLGLVLSLGLLLWQQEGAGATVLLLCALGLIIGERWLKSGACSAFTWDFGLQTVRLYGLRGWRSRAKAREVAFADIEALEIAPDSHGNYGLLLRWHAAQGGPGRQWLIEGLAAPNLHALEALCSLLEQGIGPLKNA